MIFIGTLLIITGIVYLLQNLGIISEFNASLFWPILIIALGVHLLLRNKF